MSDIINNYSYAMAYDVRGWFWNVANAARDMLKAMELGIDFGDSSSSYLTFKAWEAYTKKDYKSCLGYSKQCVEMYKQAALWQQKSLTRYPRKEEIKKYWALNDVGTCCFLAGKASQKLGMAKEAKEYFNFVKKDLYYASCWDSDGWYWKVAEAVR
ncbi:MAG: beta-glucanase precursor [Candidatus Omnitrophica bacterium]|nr:beta-glucanase precursor [Candidatus Omnitrophota bacterium]